jgi:adenylate kinase family enzyme
MQRVLVLGCSGSGKTRLSLALAERTGLPVIHLDQHYWRPGWVEPPKEEWLAQVAELLARPSWIMDGNYSGTIAERLAAADTAIFLDFPTWICFWRVLKRIVAGYGRTRPDLAPGCPEHVDFAFLLYVLRFRRRNRPRLVAAFAAYDGAVVRLTRPAEVREYLDTLLSQQLPPATRAD